MQFHGKWTLSHLESGHIKTSGWQDWLQEARTISSVAELQAVFPAVTQELNDQKSPCGQGFTNSPATANGLAVWSGGQAMETGLEKGRPHGHGPMQSLGELKRRIKVGRVDAHHKVMGTTR